MDVTALNCPQCGGLLPRAAYWRMVACPYCKAMVTRSPSVVEARRFHEAWLRTQHYLDDAPFSSARILRIGNHRYRILTSLDWSDSGEIFLADRLSAFPERVVLHLGRSGVAQSKQENEKEWEKQLERERVALSELQSLDGSGSAYYSQRIPQLVSFHPSQPGYPCCLITRHIPGTWGTLAQVLFHSKIQDAPRHSIWILRRILDTLTYLHDNGWVHGDLQPGNILLQPQDHGAFLRGWSKARRTSDKSSIAQDLARAVWCIRAFLHDNPDARNETSQATATPKALTAFLRSLSESHDAALSLGARGMDGELKRVAREVFGPPRFIPFIP
jgi:serine/threonine protein kinase